MRKIALHQGPHAPGVELVGPSDRLVVQALLAVGAEALSAEAHEDLPRARMAPPGKNSGNKSNGSTSSLLISGDWRT